MIKKYISEYINGFEPTSRKSLQYSFCGINATVDVTEYIDGINHRVTAHVTLKKGDLLYECDCADHHRWDNMLSLITIRGRDYICFSKTLYGFTFVDAETLYEEYDYFPEKVICGDESFIVVRAMSLGDLVIFDGCYWAGASSCYAYDHEKKLFVDLPSALGVALEADFECVVEDNVLIFRCFDEMGNVSDIRVTESMIYRMLDNKSVSDI